MTGVAKEHFGWMCHGSPDGAQRGLTPPNGDLRPLQRVPLLALGFVGLSSAWARGSRGSASAFPRWPRRRPRCTGR